MSQVPSEKPEGFIPYAQPLIGREETEQVLDSLASGWLSKGPKCGQFEEKFAEYVGCKYAIALNSCTSALFLALKAMGVGPGDEVITTPFTFAATANVIVHLGATPVFADIDPITYNISPAEIARKITPRTKVLLPVHYAGQSCDMGEILALAKAHNLRVLEDAAHAVHTTWGDKMVGGIGDATCFSFYVTKNLMTGEGGMLTTNDSELAQTARLLSLHGMDKDAWKRYSSAGSWYYQLHLAGYKCNMTDLQAGLGLCQLDRLPQMQATREQHAQAYTEGLQQVPGIILPQVHGKGRHAWHLYVIQVEESQAGLNRDQLIEQLQKRGIGTSVHFIPLHLQPFYRQTYGFNPGDFPVAEKVYSRIVSLPLYPKMTPAQVNRVITEIRDIVSAAGGRGEGRE